MKHNCEVPLEIYQQLQQPHAGDEKLFIKILHGLPCRQYENAARLIPQASGLSRSTVSRRFVRSSAKKLDVLLSRRLDSEAFVALVVDGKAFGEAQMIMALGIATSGEKRILGFVESGTENSRVCADFFKSLIDRGLCDTIKGCWWSWMAAKGRAKRLQRCLATMPLSNVVNGTSVRTLSPIYPNHNRPR
jgi:hypothetical protein